MTTTPVESGATPTALGIPFAVASRPQRRYSNVQTVNNLAGAGSFQVVQLPATGWVRRLHLYFTQTATGGSAGTSNDRPFNLISAITLTDATGQPVYQPISGYNLYLLNKWFGTPQRFAGTALCDLDPCADAVTPFSVSGTAASFRLTVDFEVDPRTGYGCIPNLDSNASLQLKVDYNPVTVMSSGASAATMSMRVEQEYWAPVGSSQAGVSVDTAPPGAGDYREVRYETQTVSASAENLVSLTNRGGLIQGLILVSRAAGVRTAYTAGSNVGILLDNQPINEGIPLESHNNQVQRIYGYNGPAVTTPAPTAGTEAGLDTGVVVVPFAYLSDGRNSWLNTRAGSLFQVKLTPGAAATTLEVVTPLMQVKDAATFYNATA